MDNLENPLDYMGKVFKKYETQLNSFLLSIGIESGEINEHILYNLLKNESEPRFYDTIVRMNSLNIPIDTTQRISKQLHRFSALIPSSFNDRDLCWNFFDAGLDTLLDDIDSILKQGHN